MKPRVIMILVAIAAVSLFFNVFKKESVPACMNADEAAFGYNAYSILKTGKDEYGTVMPLRLKSFGDFKMPLYSYLSVPFVGVMGLTEGSTRALNTLVAVLLPVAIFFLSRALFKNDSTALVSAFLVSVSLGLASIGRQAHEGYLATTLCTVSFLFFLRWVQTRSYVAFGLLLLSLCMFLFSYQSARIFAVFMTLFAGYQLFAKKLQLKHFLLLLGALILLSIPDIIYKPARVSNLLFFKNPGLALKTQELRQEGANKVLYNKVTVGATQFLGQHLIYYSPQFLAIRGDENYRFGFSDMPPLTYVEYGLFLTGIYFLIRKKEKHRGFILSLLLVTPLAGSLSWAGASLTRTLFLLPVIALISGYGFIELLKTIHKKHRPLATAVIIVSFSVFLFYNWNFYLNHYNGRNQVIKAQQCGYRDLGRILREEYKSADHIYISKENGEPYIFTLFYTQYDPAAYQKQASLSAPDQYGFGQVEGYDKYIFSIPQEIPAKSIVVGTPEDFKNHESLRNVDMKKVRILSTGIHEDFWVYKN